MDSTENPAVNNNKPTESSDPGQQHAPNAPSAGGIKDMTAHDTVPTSADGTEGTKPGRTDGPKNPDPPSSSAENDGSGAGTEYHTHMKGTAAPGSQSELFGLTPSEGKVHPPPGSGPGSGVIGTSGHKGTHNSIAAGAGEAASGGNRGDRGDGGGGREEEGGRGDDARSKDKPSLISRLNPRSDAD